ncbi:hypothetical protein ACHAXA_009570 [Cyclostephanos tholiformis]|uniref:Uncharacterized protein n=1 Tax=Cyclostephanos tholiformis TaxID=382380 RepID=A0ABD3SEG5_9STRA
MTGSNDAFTILIVAVSFGLGEAFVPPGVVPGNANDYDINRRGRRRRLPQLPFPPPCATIYYPDDDGGLYVDNDTTMTSSFSNESFDPSSFFHVPPPPLEFDSTHHPANDDVVGHDYDDGMDLLVSIAENLPRSTLARLASAFSPPGYDIDITKLNDVRCRYLDWSRMDIEAIVCDDIECNSLLVPVHFPDGCDVMTMTSGRERQDDEIRRRTRSHPSAVVRDCILRNVERLDVGGDDAIRGGRRRTSYSREGEGDVEAKRAMMALKSLGGGGVITDDDDDCELSS